MILPAQMQWHTIVTMALLPGFNCKASKKHQGLWDYAIQYDDVRMANYIAVWLWVITHQLVPNNLRISIILFEVIWHATPKRHVKYLLIQRARLC
jgi:hypothetical protein